MTALAERIAAVRRPAPRSSTIASAGVLIGFVVIGILSLAQLGFSWQAISGGFDRLGSWIERATPLVWPGFAYDRQTGAAVWFGELTNAQGAVIATSWGEVGDFVVAIGVTLGIVIVGTFLSALLSIPIAYFAARNTTSGPIALAVARGIGVVARAIPDIAFAAVFVLAMRLGALPGILAIALHSIGMISKMFADAIEQTDEGPRTAIRATGGTKLQQFWSGVVPQVLPAWIAIGLHRADINLRGSVILGYVGVAGLGYELSVALATFNYRRAIPIAIVLVLLCVLFEVVSSVIRARLLGVRPAGRGIGDSIVRAAARRSSRVARAIESRDGEDRTAAIQAAMRRPWTGERLAGLLSVVVGVAVLAASFVLARADWADLWTAWGNLAFLGGRIWPPTFGEVHGIQDILEAVLVTVQVAFAATLLSAVVCAVVGTLAARNVAPNGIVRNTFRGILLFVRGIPELILAIFFVLVTGLGATAGTLALAIGGVGLLGKLMADSLEEAPNGPERAISAVGGTKPQRFFASTLPYTIPAFVAHLLYLLEQNVRAAVLLGMVGGGGIGYYLHEALRVSKFDQVLAIVAVIVVLVLVIEVTAILLRRALK